MKALPRFLILLIAAAGFLFTAGCASTISETEAVEDRAAPVLLIPL
ncbi:MAG TPA: hypothetical protein VMN36_15220 [Verrucomicrobiales bacterium]|nr:hypothetical protein [Verrucomicrobiales bacterium]